MPCVLYIVPIGKQILTGVVAILFQKSGNETLAERWIFHKLNQTAIKVNKAFESRNFHDVTEIIHGFWLYELCDVFIVRDSRG